MNAQTRASDRSNAVPETTDPLRDLVTRHRSGEAVGLPSLCSAHPLVLQAAMEEAAVGNGMVLIEATSNQVDQNGGYTQMRPPDFRDLVHGIAARAGVAAERIVLGGDHLGPNTWRDLNATAAMANAEALVAAYVAAGFTKIHLDCSMPCSGDPTPLSDEVVASRSIHLMQVAEQAAAGGRPVSYVIGTEVPTPGGSTHALTELAPTSRSSALHTLNVHHQAVADHGLEAVWPRVRALVVQPGVEFDHMSVVDYDRARSVDLRSVLADEPDMVFEAHSTDYQTPSRLRALVEDHWAILKVGPALTFALREGLVGLAAIEKQLIAPSGSSRLLEVIETRMRAAPRHWASHYHGDDRSQKLARLFSFSDRIRYYWPDPEITHAEQVLLDNLGEAGIPLPLLSQYLPEQYARIREGHMPADPRAIVLDKVKSVIRLYEAACSAEMRRERS